MCQLERFKLFLLVFIVVAIGLVSSHPVVQFHIAIENEINYGLVDNAENSATELRYWEELYPFKKLAKVIAATRRGEPVGGIHFTCYSCKLAIKAMQFLVHMGAGKEKLASLARGLCKKFRVTTDRVCDGISEAYKDEVLFVFSKVSLNPIDVCGSILDQDCGSGVDPSNNWTVALPHVPKPPVVPVPLPKVGSPVLRVLQLSDVHFDPLYQEGASAVCGEPLCCRSIDQPPKSPDMAAGPWGDYRNCDTPLQTLENALQHISKTHQIDYILWTGDDPPHNIWNQSINGQIAILEKVASLIESYFPGIPVFPALGNHEGIPVNSFPPASVSSSMDWLYQTLSKTWTRWLPNKTCIATILKGGFYSVPVFPGFRIISLNMNYCNNLNWWLLLNTTDPLGELQWLINELENAEVRGEKVHIIGHIPPGSTDCLHMWSANYYRIISRYESTIRSQFFGHTHVDEFEMFYDTSGGQKRAISTAYVGPSITPYVSLNPAYRMYTIDGNYTNSTWTVLDHETYYLNLTDANISRQPKWNLLYTAKSSYNMTSLQPEEWQKMVERMSSDDEFFQLYYRHYHRESSAYAPCVSGPCKQQLLCHVQSGASGDVAKCKPSQAESKKSFIYAM